VPAYLAYPVPPSMHLSDHASAGSTVHQTAGLWLGLFISPQVVELHGGRIEAASPPGGGACLTITLPTRPRVAV
jgi:signal transduction histidine kinase